MSGERQITLAVSDDTWREVARIAERDKLSVPDMMIGLIAEGVMREVLMMDQLTRDAMRANPGMHRFGDLARDKIAL